MAFIQQHRPQSGRQISYNAPDATTTAPQIQRPLEQSEEWVLFSPHAPSETTRTHTTSTDRTPRTAGLSRFSEFGSLETAARSDHDDDVGTFLGTEEELDSLDEGLHAFHEPSEFGAPVGRVQQSADTVLPTHDGLGEFEPDATMQQHMWQFERQRRTPRRRSSVQRHLTILEDAEGLSTEEEKRMRIERWRLEQSKALLEEIEKETRRRRRMSMVSNGRSRVENAQQASTGTLPTVAQSVLSAQSESSDEGTENMSFWQRITRRVIRDLIGLDDDTLSVIFGESLPDEGATPTPGTPAEYSTDRALQEAGVDASQLTDDTWQTKLLERVAQELGTLVNQLSEHPGAFSTYQRTQAVPDYAGLMPVRSNTTLASDPLSTRPSSSHPTTSPASAQFAPTFPIQTSNTYSEASLWGIEEEPAEAPTPAPDTSIADDLAREREYWERELDVKMIFNFLMKRFSSSRRPSFSSSSSSLPRPRPQPQHPQAQTPPPAPSLATSNEDNHTSAHRAAIIRQNHPLVNRTTSANRLPSSSALPRESRRYAAYYTPPPPPVVGLGAKAAKLRSSSSCASQSTKKSKRSAGSRGNYWDLGGSVGSGGVVGEV